MKRVRLNSQVRKAFQGRSRGLSLIDVMIAIALVGVIAIAFLSSLSTASRVLIIADERATAESLARSQMEYVKNQPNPPAEDEYVQAGYKIKSTSEDVTSSPGLKKITIEIYRHPDDEEPLVTLVGYKLVI